jgi:hypothetical protein
MPSSENSPARKGEVVALRCLRAVVRQGRGGRDRGGGPARLLSEVEGVGHMAAAEGKGVGDVDHGGQVDVAEA